MPLNRIFLSLLIGKTTPKKVNEEMLQAMQAVEIMQADDSSDAYRQGFQIRFNVGRKKSASPNYALLNEPNLQPGNRVVITVSLDAKPTVLMDGIITYQQLSFETGSRDPVFIVMGKDLSVLMDLEEKRTGFAGMKPKAVVDKILGAYKKHGMQPKVTAPSVEWPIEPKEHMPFQVGTDLDYVRALAKANGYIFNVQPGPQPKKSIAYWGPPNRSATPQPALTFNMGANDNVDQLNFIYDALEPTQVKNAIPGDQVSLEEIKKSNAKVTLAKRVALKDQGDFVRQRWLTHAGPDDGETSSRSQGIVDLANENVVRVNGSLNALNYGNVLQAPGIVGVRGVGTMYGGNYYVKSAKHIIGRGTYTQEFTLTREGVGSKKSTVTV